MTWIAPPVVGYKGFGPGSGPGPQGLTNSPGLPGGPVTGVKLSPGATIGSTVNQGFYVIIAATGVPQRAPHMFVPPGAQVLVRAHNGGAGNNNTVYLDQAPEFPNGGDPITPDSEITWATDNTINLWLKGTAGDGIRISVQRQGG